MKTFKLKMLQILTDVDKEINIPLLNGLIIDREDENNNWLIEAYITKQYKELFEPLLEKEEIFVKVKITKESNEPALFKTKIIGINEIGKNINVLLIGKIIIKSNVSKE